MNTHEIETVLRSFLTGDGYIAADDIPTICSIVEANRQRRVMTTKNTGGPAFPDSEGQADYTGGMTLRDYFAAKAMQSMLLDTKQFAGCGLGEAPLAAVPDIIAGWSYLMADAMLNAREESND